MFSLDALLDLTDELDVFCRSFEFFIIDLLNNVYKNSFDSKICCFLKSNSKSKHFSFFVFYFNISNKTSPSPLRLLNFQEYSNLHVNFNSSPVY